MSVTHKNLAAGRWAQMPFSEQMANVGSEVERTISWKKKGNVEYSRLAFERALELLDLSVKDAKTLAALKELSRVRETLADHFSFDNQYHTTDESWQKYFYAFNYAARVNR